MQENAKQYSFSLFKPLNKFGKKNRNLIITLLLIWFVAIFGFQVLLVLTGKPTREKTLLVFQSVAGKVKTGECSSEDKNTFINSLVMVAGKSLIKPDDRLLIDKAISWAVYDIIGEESSAIVSDKVSLLFAAKEKLPMAKDDEYAKLQQQMKELKTEINALAGTTTGTDPMNLKESILPYNLLPGEQVMNEADWVKLNQIMSFYLTHNQSFLTNTTFLGFPFHYFYTAEFLLFLFVGICLLYSFLLTRLQKKYAITE